MAVKFAGGKPAKHDFTEHLVVQKAVGTVDKEKKSGVNAPFIQTSSKEESVSPGLMLAAEQACMVEVSGGRTINLGNYESARINVTLRMPCAKDEIEEAYQFATDWVSAKVEEASKVGE